MPLLRVTCPPERTEAIVAALVPHPAVHDVAVLPAASRSSGADLILADVSRASIDMILERLATEHPDGLRVSVEASEPLFPRAETDDADADAVVWAQVADDLRDLGRLSWINTSLILIAAAIAAVGIIEDQLLLIVGAMALSPDYYPIASTCLAITRRDRRQARNGLRTIWVVFAVGAIGAGLFTELLARTGIVTADAVPSRQVTLFISEPSWLSVIVALLAGIAGALAITLPDARGLVGVFVSITTIPAAANIGVAFVARNWTDLGGAAVQLVANVVSLIIAGVITLQARHIHLKRQRPSL